jgi:hypothetical protein
MSHKNKYWYSVFTNSCVSTFTTQNFFSVNIHPLEIEGKGICVFYKELTQEEYETYKSKKDVQNNNGKDNQPDQL